MLNPEVPKCHEDLITLEIYIFWVMFGPYIKSNADLITVATYVQTANN